MEHAELRVDPARVRARDRHDARADRHHQPPQPAAPAARQRRQAERQHGRVG